MASCDTSGGTMPSSCLPAWLRPLHEILPVGVGLREVQGGPSYLRDVLVTRRLTVLTSATG
ncbi:hypothetical protein ACFWP5_43615 [Streptomyces sp. NPDC058469]|uniref:hypothetical protein n=1 Tax=Streptomyces sp. NPDC058469 TaxID=3346514 RepID=UPI003646388A